MNKRCFIIHGIGDQKPDYAYNIVKNLEDKFYEVDFIPICWSRLFDTYEEELLSKLSKYNMGFMNKFVIMNGVDVLLYEKLKRRLYDYLDFILSPYLNEEINFIAHSLGSVILSDYIWDRKLKVNNLYTLGSPIALYSIGNEIFNKPIIVNNWINIWSEYDAISYPLKVLNYEYDLAVKKDIKLNSWNPILRLLRLTHNKYFEMKNFYKIVYKEWK